MGVLAPGAIPALDKAEVIVLESHSELRGAAVTGRVPLQRSIRNRCMARRVTVPMNHRGVERDPAENLTEVKSRTPPAPFPTGC